MEKEILNQSTLSLKSLQQSCGKNENCLETEDLQEKYNKLQEKYKMLKEENTKLWEFVNQEVRIGLFVPFYRFF